MATQVVKKSKTATKRNRSSAKGTASRKKVSVRNTGRGNVNVAMVGKARKK
jgi:hypothetical protein